jgi:hypothetical protein
MLALASTLSCHVGWGSPVSNPEEKSPAAAAGVVTAKPRPMASTAVASQAHARMWVDLKVVVMANPLFSEGVANAAPTDRHLVSDEDPRYLR